MRPLFITLLLFTTVVTAFCQRDFPYVFVEYDSAWTFQNLKLIPIRYRDEGGGMVLSEFKSLTTLSQAMKSSRFRIMEVQSEDGADVNVLQVRNRTKKPVVIHTGELITGGKQDRVAAQTMILPPSKEDYYIDVFCAEKGRWDKKAKPFFYDGFADAGLRKIVDKQRQQHEVWKAIAEVYKQKGLESETWTYRNLNNVKKRGADSAYYNYFLNKFRQSDSSYAGFIAITGERILAVDVYCHEFLTQQHYQNIISGYIREAVDAGDAPVMPKTKIEDFMSPILSDSKTRDAFLEKHGRAFRFDNKVIHITAYGE